MFVGLAQVIALTQKRSPGPQLLPRRDFSMCCFLTVLVPARWVGVAFDSAIWPILGLIFLPWSTLMYVAVSPGGVTGFFDWAFLILAIIIDIGAYAGGGIGNRDRIPGM
jgi:hypothetical protein